MKEWKVERENTWRLLYKEQTILSRAVMQSEAIHQMGGKLMRMIQEKDCRFIIQQRKKSEEQENHHDEETQRHQDK